MLEAIIKQELLNQASQLLFLPKQMIVSFIFIFEGIDASKTRVISQKNAQKKIDTITRLLKQRNMINTIKQHVCDLENSGIKIPEDLLKLINDYYKQETFLSVSN